MTHAAFLSKQLEDLAQAHLLRNPRVMSGAQGVRVVIEGKSYLNFCSNDYLGLANDPRLIKAASEAMAKDGLGSGASRLVCGTHEAHQALERKIASFKSKDAGLVFSSGYMANCGIISSLVDRDDTVFTDRLNHASIIDGIVLSRAKMQRYHHNDMAHLEELLKASLGTRGKKLIITDSVFSMDGDCADLKNIVRLAKVYDATVMIDEAHAFGVLGAHGEGLAHHLGVANHIEVQMGTLSKAAGCFGAYVVGSKLLRDYLVNSSRSFIYTTALPQSLMAAASCAMDIIQNDDDRRQKVLANADFLREQLKQCGFDTAQSQTPIIPVILGDEQTTVALSARLFEQGIWVSAIRPPTVPKGSARLRITVTANHTQEDLECLITAMSKG